MNTEWDKVGHGRYALKHGHDVLQVMYAPDRDSDDKRPYIAIVEKKPLPRRYWSLKEAKTGAMDAAGANGHGRQNKETSMSKAMLAAAQRKIQPTANDLLDQAAIELAAMQAPKPQQNGHRADAVLEAVRDLERYEPAPEQTPEPAPERAPEQTPEPLAAVSRVSIDLPRDLAAPDAAAVLERAQTSIARLQEIMTLLTQAQAAAQLLSELGVPCRLELKGVRL